MDKTMVEALEEIKEKDLPFLPPDENVKNGFLIAMIMVCMF